jgi:hypothetical protein
MVVDTPQRRRRIQQIASNAFPGSTVVFLRAPRGALAFRIRSVNGRFRTGIIKLLSHHGKVRLNQSWLQRQLLDRGGPAKP